MQTHPHVQRYLDGEIESLICQAFLRCINPAETMIEHPIFDQVPACDGCAEYLQMMETLNNPEEVCA
jgi:hypothetical protein